MGEDHVAGRDATPDRTREDRQHHSAASLDSQQEADWRVLQERIRALDEPLQFTADIMPTAAALLHPKFGNAVLHLLAECYRSATSGGTRECHGCCRPWTRERAVVGVGIVEFLNVQGLGLVGLCPACWGRPDRLQIAIAGFQRDFGLRSVEVAPIHAGARA